MDNETFEKIHAYDPPRKKLDLLLDVHGTWRHAAVQRNDAQWRKNEEEARYWQSQEMSMTQRGFWLYLGLTHTLMEGGAFMNWKTVAKDGKPTGKQLATRDSRWFGDAAKAGCGEWAMKDQPDYGLVWTEETGSYSNERVYAWLPQRDYPGIDLPEGVQWDG